MPPEGNQSPIFFRQVSDVIIVAIHGVKLADGVEFCRSSYCQKSSNNHSKNQHLWLPSVMWQTTSTCKIPKFRHDCPKNGSAFGFGCFPLVRNFFLPLRRQGKYHWRKHSRTIGHTLKWCRKGIQTCKTVVMRPATENCCFCGVCCAFSHLGLIFLSRTATSRLGSTTLTRNHGEHVMAWDVLVASKKQKCFGLILPRWEHMQWLVAYRLRVCISLDRWWKMVPIFFGNKVLT